MILSQSNVSSATAEEKISGLKQGTYMAYLIQETARNGTLFQTVDSYYVVKLQGNGSFDAQIKWGVSGYPTDPVYVTGLMPINPSDPDLRTLLVVVDLRVQDGVYRFIGSINRIHRGSIVYNGIHFDAIMSNETVFDPAIPELIYYHAVYYYDAVTGILLHSDFQYGPPGFEVARFDLIATNALSLAGSGAFARNSESPLPEVLFALLSVCVVLFPIAGFLAKKQARK